MTILTRTQAEALATFIVRVREDWSHGGVMAALEKSNIVDALDTARAVVNLAADPTAKTPALLAKPGPWWRNPAGENVGHGSNNMRCHVHGDQEIPCSTCRAEYVPASPHTVQAAMATIRADLAAHQPRPARPAPLGTRRLIEGGGQ